MVILQYIHVNLIYLFSVLCYVYYLIGYIVTDS